MTRHDWQFVRVLHYDMKLWQCSKCGSESWTLCNNERPHICRPPERDTETSKIQARPKIVTKRSYET
jgi:hypothetical protein